MRVLLLAESAKQDNSISGDPGESERFGQPFADHC